MATVLVMDDDDIVRNLIVRVVGLKNHRAVAFPDAGPALETVDFDQIDLIITDLSMPTNGEETIRILRQRGVHVPIIVVSGQMQETKADYLRSIGVQATLSKPFQLQELLGLIERWL